MQKQPHTTEDVETSLRMEPMVYGLPPQPRDTANNPYLTSCYTEAVIRTICRGGCITNTPAAA